MRDFPSCFSESGVQIIDSSSSQSTPFSTPHRASHNLVTYVYECRFHGLSRFITIAWSRTLMGQGVSIGVQTPTNEYLCKVEIKPWIFTRRKGFRTTRSNSNPDAIIDVYWDFSMAKFGSSSSPEPKEGFYIAITFNQNLVLVLGDLHLQLQKQINKKLAMHPNLVSVSGSGSNAVLVAKREHIFGKKKYEVKAKFNDTGRVHDILIECETERVNDPFLAISVDGKVAMRVKRLRWKFRGNGTILVDGVAVQVYWDVHSWFFGNVLGNAVFMFQTCVSGSGHDDEDGKGFSLVLYAWKSE